MKDIKRVMVWSVGTMVLTLIHHAYGAAIYDKPFRLHVAIYAIPVIVILLGTYLGFEKIRSVTSKKIMLAVFLVVALLFPTLAIGVYEGGYNHVVKNILYFTGTPTDIIDQIYPSIYELPNDVVFELTGMAQFLTGFQCGVALYRSRLRRWFELPGDPTWQKNL